ncbi:MAG: HAD family phosphatase [Candidatus Promineifilaceae bacterium]|nr:HAD family phosphatase [Anaerolineaceae bacterium]
MIETIIFDIGGVLFHAPSTSLSDKWAHRCGLSSAEFDEIVFNSPYYQDAAVGKISNEDLWQGKIERLGLTVDDGVLLQDDYWEGVWDGALLGFIQTLKPHYKLGILSDATSGARERVSEWIDLSLFDAVLFSYEAGLAKPNPEIYLRILAMLGATAVTTLFIDDRTHNVQAALDLGMSSFQYTNTPETITCLQQLLK